MSRVRTLYGPPGTGKTTEGLRIVEEALRAGVAPQRIAYCSFTRVAAREAAERAVAKFGMKPDDFPYFRTLHSIAFRELELTRGDVMGPKQWKELGTAMGLELDVALDHHAERFETSERGLPQRLLQCYSLARARLRTVEEEWRLGNWSDLPLWAVMRFERQLNQYKNDNKVRDFTDFLDDCQTSLGVDLFVVDEVQDLTPQQWRFARRLAAHSPKVVLAGDDDQAIFDWAGSDSQQMRRFKGERVVLPQSFRLPRSVHGLADHVVKQIRRREPKVWRPRDEEGTVEFLESWNEVDFSQGEWLILARHRRGLHAIEQHLRSEGFVYQREHEWSNQDPAVRAVVLYEKLRRGEAITQWEARTVMDWVIGAPRPPAREHLRYSDITWPWPRGETPDWMTGLTRLSDLDREYVRALLRRGESVTKVGRITLSTVHGAKGAEAENVLVLGGANRRVREGVDQDPDNELRVVYVAATRAKKSLLICQNGLYPAM